MVGDLGNGQNTIGLTEGCMDIQEKLHEAAIAMCDLAFEIANRRDDFKTRFVEMGFTGASEGIDFMWLTYDLGEGDTLQVMPVIAANYEMVVRDAELKEKEAQTLRSGPSTMPDEFQERVDMHTKHMPLPKLFTMLNVVATCIPRVPTDAEENTA